MYRSYTDRKSSPSSLRTQVLLVLLTAVAFSSIPAAFAQSYNTFVLNTNSRTWGFSGSLELSIIDWSGTIRVKHEGGHPFTINLEPGDNVVLNIDDDDSHARFWMGRDGWVNWREIDAGSIYVNGVLAAEDVTILTAHFRADVETLNSTLELRVERDPSGWTSFRLNGENIIRGRMDNSEIIVSGVSPTQEKSLNININRGSQYAEGGAASAYVNSAEVPELGSPLALLGLGLVGIIVSFLGFKLKARRLV